jgi:hypothetical protein
MIELLGVSAIALGCGAWIGWGCSQWRRDSEYWDDEFEGFDIVFTPENLDDLDLSDPDLDDLEDRLAEAIYLRNEANTENTQLRNALNRIIAKFEGQKSGTAQAVVRMARAGVAK